MAMKRTGYCCLVSSALAAFAALVFAGAAAAMTVATTTDGGGGCSLRAAIEAVNTNNGGGSCGALGNGTTTIELPAGHYTLTKGELLVAANANLAIVGADPEDPSETMIDGNEQSRVFEVASKANATLDGVEVTGGATLHGADAAAPDGLGGAGEIGGGILNHGSLTLEHVLVTANRTGRGGNGGNGAIANTAARNGGYANNGGSGGGIYNESGASLIVQASTISVNRTGDGGAGGTGAHGSGGLGNIPAGGDGGIGGHAGDGGGIYNAGTATIAATTVSGNGTGRGGPGGDGGEGADATEGFSAGLGGWGALGGNSGLLYSESGFPTYAEEGGGGGIANLGTLTMTASTIADNNTGAGGLGGGAGLGGEREAPQSGRTTSGKAGEGGSAGLGGGLLSVEAGTSSLTDVTVSGNLTGDGGTGGNGAQSSSRGGGPGGFGGFGGGIWARGNGAGLQLDFVTIAANSVGAVGAGGSDAMFPGIPGERGKGAGIATGPSSGSGGGVSVANSVVSGNGQQVSGDTNCSEFGAGAVHDGGSDVSYPDNSCPGVTGDPLLGALAANGGPTETMLPGAGSSAIGLVPLGSCSVGEDQRGLSRPGSGKSSCDAGAVEAGGSAGGPTSTSTLLSSSGGPSVVGASVTFTATVSPSPGGGTVAFRDGAGVISGCAAKPVVAGQATCTETISSAGSHSIVAEFSGTASFESSTSPSLTQVVQAASEVTGGGGTGTGGGSTGGGSTPPPGGGSGSPPGTGSGGPSAGSSSAGGSSAGQVSAGAIKSHGAIVLVALACAGPSDVTCVLKVLLSASEGGGKGSAARVTARTKAPKRVVVGVASVTIKSGAKKVVSVSLNAAGKKMLASAGSLKATLTVTESGRSTPILTRGVKFTARAPAKARGSNAIWIALRVESFAL